MLNLSDKVSATLVAQQEAQYSGEL